MMLATPRAIDIIASVAMKAGMFRRVTIRPDTTPQTAEAISAAAMREAERQAELSPR